MPWVLGTSCPPSPFPFLQHFRTRANFRGLCFSQARRLPSLELTTTVSSGSVDPPGLLVWGLRCPHCPSVQRWGWTGQEGPWVPTKAWVFNQSLTDTQTMASIHGEPTGWRLQVPIKSPNRVAGGGLSPTQCQWPLGSSAFETFQKGGQATSASALNGLFLVLLEFFSLNQEQAALRTGWAGRPAQLGKEMLPQGHGLSCFHSLGEGLSPAVQQRPKISPQGLPLNPPRTWNP